MLGLNRQHCFKHNYTILPVSTETLRMHVFKHIVEERVPLVEKVKERSSPIAFPRQLISIIERRAVVYTALLSIILRLAVAIENKIRKPETAVVIIMTVLGQNDS